MATIVPTFGGEPDPAREHGAFLFGATSPIIAQAEQSDPLGLDRFPNPLAGIFGTSKSSVMPIAIEPHATTLEGRLQSVPSMGDVLTMSDVERAAESLPRAIGGTPQVPTLLDRASDFVLDIAGLKDQPQTTIGKTIKGARIEASQGGSVFRVFGEEYAAESERLYGFNIGTALKWLPLAVVAGVGLTVFGPAIGKTLGSFVKGVL